MAKFDKIEQSVAALNNALMNAMRDTRVDRREAADIIRKLNEFQAITREEYTTFLKEHGHAEVAERFNQLEFKQRLFTGIDRPGAPLKVNQNFMNHFAGREYPPPTPVTWPEPSGLTKPIETLGETILSIPRVRPRTKQKLIWALIVGGSTIASLLFKLGAI